jgi:uncharacterized protein (TIGR02246 family)
MVKSEGLPRPAPATISLGGGRAMTSQPRPSTDADESAIRAIHFAMIAAWNDGNADAFAAPFSETADFIAFEGTHLKGRERIEVFHREIFADAVKGSRLEGSVAFVHFLTDDIAVMHSRVRVTLAGRARPMPSRDSMQLTVVRRHEGKWRGEALMNARVLTLARQYFLDDLDKLPQGAQQDVAALVAGQA